MKETKFPSPEKIEKTEKRLKSQLAIFFRNKGLQECDRDKTLKWYRYFLKKLKSGALTEGDKGEG